MVKPLVNFDLRPMSNQEPDTKKRILAAAEAEFLAGGFDRARMQAIADRAEINKAMLHYHFRSKGELFAQIFKDKAKLLFPTIEASLQTQDSFVGVACGFIDAYFTLLIDNPRLPFLLLQVAAHHPELLEQIDIDFPRKFVQVFDIAVSNNEIRRHDARQFIVSIMGMCVMPFVGKNLIKHALDLNESNYNVLLKTRAEEIKRYVVLLLRPEQTTTLEQPHV